MAVLTYNQGRTDIGDGTIDFLTNTIKIMLVTASYVANKNDQFVDEAGANDPIDHELSGTGYAAGFAGSGRKTLATKAVTKDDPNDRAEWDADNITWTGINAGTAAAAIMYFHNTADTDSVLIAYIDSGGFPIVTNGGDLSINWNVEGIFQHT